MKKFSVFVVCVISFNLVYSQNLYFPPINNSYWETINPVSLSWNMNDTVQLFQYLDSCNTKAFIILKDGKIAIEKYFGNFNKDSSWYWASAGKTVTSFLIGVAQENGYLKISDTSSKYLGNGWTNCTLEQEQKITIRNQLSMTTGLDDEVVDNHCTNDTCLVYKADAGTRWAYHNAPYTLLDKVIVNSTGMDLNFFLLIN